jgi:hypothetical protein
LLIVSALSPCYKRNLVIVENGDAPEADSEVKNPKKCRLRRQIFYNNLYGRLILSVEDVIRKSCRIVAPAAASR